MITYNIILSIFIYTYYSTCEYVNLYKEALVYINLDHQYQYNKSTSIQ